MEKFTKVSIAALTLLIICAFISTNVLAPGAKETKTPTAINIDKIEGDLKGKNSQKAPPTINGRGSVTYHNVNLEVFSCMKQKLTNAGVNVPQENEGDLEGYGAKVHFKWDGVTNLTITIKNKPWYLSDKTITGKIHDFVNTCGGN